MLIDLLIFPLLSLVIFATKYGLLYTGIASPVIFLTSLFALVHLILTLFMTIKLRGYHESVVPHYGVANAVSFLTALAAVVSYVAISYIPFLKAPFFLLKYIPSNQYWADHLIVGIPTYLVFRVSNYIAQGLLHDDQ